MFRHIFKSQYFGHGCLVIVLGQIEGMTEPPGVNFINILGAARFLYESAFLAPKFCTKALFSSYVLAKKDFHMKNACEKC